MATPSTDAGASGISWLTRSRPTVSDSCTRLLGLSARIRVSVITLSSCAASAQLPPSTSVAPGSVAFRNAPTRFATSSRFPPGPETSGDSRANSPVCVKSAIPFLIRYSAWQTGQPSVPSRTNRFEMALSDATSHVSSCTLMHRSKSSSSMNMRT